MPELRMLKATQHKPKRRKFRWGVRPLKRLVSSLFLINSAMLWFRSHDLILVRTLQSFAGNDGDENIGIKSFDRYYTIEWQGLSHHVQKPR
jgi:hypothetical protein